MSQIHHDRVPESLQLYIQPRQKEVLGVTGNWARDHGIGKRLLAAIRSFDRFVAPSLGQNPKPVQTTFGHQYAFQNLSANLTYVIRTESSASHTSILVPALFVFVDNSPNEEIIEV